MLKKYKILMSIIALLLAGIVAIMCIWLYGIYQNKEEFLVSEVERSLFNATQVYYRSHVEEDKQIKRPYERYLHEFVNRLLQQYPDMERHKIDLLMDSMVRFRDPAHPLKEGRKSTRENRDIIPPFMMQQLSFGNDDLVEMNAILDSLLEAKQIFMTTKTELLVDKEQDIRHYRRRYEWTAEGDIRTRSILLNPDKSQFLSAVIQHPSRFILGKMLFQIILSLLLLVALLGTFFYLFWTINRQNKMAVLRKSFVNNMTHELKTPIATVMAAIEAVQRYGARDDKQKMERYMEISKRELDHLSNMIEHVLQLDRDEVRGIVLDKVDVDLRECLQECVEIARISCGKAITVEMLNQCEDPVVLADKAHIKSVFNNLLDNAIKYAKDDVHVVISLQDSAKNIKIKIEDNGIGIDPKYLGDVFDMFFRVPSGHLHTVKGFGLGLSYVKQIIEQHGGSITVESKVNQGTIFTILLPKS